MKIFSCDFHGLVCLEPHEHQKRNTASELSQDSKSMERFELGVNAFLLAVAIIQLFLF